MKQRYILIGFIVISLILIGFLAMRNKNIPDEILVGIEELNAFESKIALVENKIIDLTNPNDLIKITEFNELVKQVSFSNNVVYSFVSDSNKSEQQKRIAIYALRDLDFESYLNFFEKCLLLYQKKRLTDNIIMTVLSPGVNWNCSIIQNYKDKRVTRLLENNIEGMSEELKEVFKYTLSGEIWTSIEDEKRWSHEE